MKKILFNCCLRNNQLYIPYMFDCFKKNEEFNKDKYDFSYLFYTNNNTDNTLELLEKGAKNFKKIKIINEDLDPKLLQLKRVERLYHIREKFLNIIRKEDFDYAIMLDSDILFNGAIVRKFVDKFENNNYEALISDTVNNNKLGHYDSFALILKDKNKCLKEENILIKFLTGLRIILSRDIIPIKSGFAGFCIIKQEVLKDKNNSYFNDPIDNEICEHISFFKNINLGLVPDINPIRVHQVKDNKYEKDANFTKKIMDKNNSSNRWNEKSIQELFLIIFRIIIIVFLILFLLFIISKINK